MAILVVDVRLPPASDKKEGDNFLLETRRHIKQLGDRLLAGAAAPSSVALHLATVPLALLIVQGRGARVALRSQVCTIDAFHRAVDAALSDDAASLDDASDETPARCPGEPSV
jgi:hypothetical protein